MAKKKYPHPTKPDVLISVQERWQLKNEAKGCCRTCGKPRALYAHYCDSCHTKRRHHRKNGDPGQPWRQGGRGRPPKSLTTQAEVTTHKRGTAVA